MRPLGPLTTDMFIFKSKWQLLQILRNSLKQTCEMFNRPTICFVRRPWPLTSTFKSGHPWVQVDVCTRFGEIPSRRSWDNNKKGINAQTTCNIKPSATGCHQRAGITIPEGDIRLHTIYLQTSIHQCTVELVPIWEFHLTCYVMILFPLTKYVEFSYFWIPKRGNNNNMMHWTLTYNVARLLYS